MHLVLLFIENFRSFGSEADGRHLQMSLRPGLNVLAGENDSGKTAIVDAIRHVLWTTSLDYLRLNEDDFHVSPAGRAHSLRITCTFSGFTEASVARFLEWLSVDDAGEPMLCVTLSATRQDEQTLGGKSGRRIAYTVRSGKQGDGPAIEGEIREFLRVTYLRPLRDAEGELAAGKGSRLAQVLQSHPRFQGENTDDFDPHDPQPMPRTLVGIMRHAEYRIANNDVVTAAQRQLNDDYLQHVSVGDERLTGSVGVARSTELRQILEKLELRLDPRIDIPFRTPRGLGFNNVLFMMTELLLLDENSNEAFSMLLIEEPEAHLHPQLQLRLMDFLDRKCSGDDLRVQVLLTTHSSFLASKVDLETITLVHGARGFSLTSSATQLNKSDYRFLRRFLDVTKANLFFAKGVVIVEGDAENILLPVLAELIDRSFSKHGVSVINVGSRGLFRYARIFQRKDEQVLPIRVACLADRDIPPVEANAYVAQKKNTNGEDVPTYSSDFTAEQLEMRVDALRRGDGGCVQTFISPTWTFEFDLAECGIPEYIHAATQIAKAMKTKTEGLKSTEIVSIIRTARKEIADARSAGLSEAQVAASVYQDLKMKRASKAETAQVLAELLVRKRMPSHELRAKLPNYIVAAIDYVTRSDAPVEGNDAADA